MTAGEDRELRDAAKKCIEGEFRVKLLEKLLEKGIGLREIEEFVAHEGGKRRVNMEKTNKVSYGRQRAIVQKMMKDKLMDCRKDCINLRRDKTDCLKRLENRLGQKSDKVEKIKTEIKAHGLKLRGKLTRKNDKKVNFSVGFELNIAIGTTDSRFKQ